jgi:hypothetical protein
VISVHAIPVKHDGPISEGCVEMQLARCSPILAPHLVVHSVASPLLYKYQKCLLTYLLAYGAEPFLRSHQLCSHSRTSHFMEPEGSIQCRKSTPLVPILSHINPIHSIPSDARFILVLFTHLRGRPRGRSSSPGRIKNFLFSKSSRPGLRSTQPPIQWVPGALSLTVKRPGREVDHSPPTSAEVKKVWIYTSIPPYVFMA